MILISKILSIVTLLICINSIIYPFIEKRTKYKGNTQGDSTDSVFIWLTILFGPLMFFFIKSIKRHRKHKYLRNRIMYYKLCGRKSYYKWYGSLDVKESSNSIDKKITCFIKRFYIWKEYIKYLN